MNPKKSKRGGMLPACGVMGGMIAVAAVAACGPIHSAGPQQVYAANPSITYNYSTDQELLQAGDRASVFCSQYQARTMRSGTISQNPDGTNSVSFECVPVAAPAGTVAAVPPAVPMTYSYTTSQELLTASQNAESYCLRQGKRSSATVTTNPDGTKAATFQCVS
jgi:hypothetical protein